MSEVYRERVAYCREMAEQAPNEEIKADWLRTAETWLFMAAEHARKGEVVALRVVGGAEPPFAR